MNRRAGLALGAVLAFVATLSVTACGRDATPDGQAYAAPGTHEATTASQTTPATRPVVTVYKSPT